MNTVTTQDGAAAAVRLAGGAPLEAALALADPGSWLALDIGVREVGWSWYREQARSEWERSAPLPADLSRLDEGRLALALCHRDGRTRALALRSAARYPRLLPLVVIRCADWVDPVRERARDLLREMLTPDDAVALAPVILLVGRRGRGAFAAELLAGVLPRAPRADLATLFRSSDRSLRRFAYHLTVEHRLLSPAELARTAAGDADTVVQNLCADAALAAVPDDACDDVLEPLLGARSPVVRSAGVTALRRAGRAARAVEFLADRAGLVRACARYVVRQGGMDPLPWYRERCAEPEGLPPGAVIGLAECGERGDAEVLWALLGHPVEGVRARAVAGLRVLDVTDVRRLRPLLDDPAPGVVREVTAALLPSAEAVPEEELIERLGAGWPRSRPRHVRAAAFRLLDARGGVVRLRAAVAALDDPDERIRDRARRSVRSRYAPVGVPPGAAAEVGELLGRARRLLDARVS
ncbi:hypothetical protein [Streptomyces sp. NPDC096132]|uniref:hypothetical protein n=1 Tax=Streptomyces sp. NPDC096132 TaxID=3366075 RepID=UPI00382DFBA4